MTLPLSRRRILLSSGTALALAALGRARRRIPPPAAPRRAPASPPAPPWPRRSSRTCRHDQPPPGGGPGRPGPGVPGLPGHGRGRPRSGRPVLRIRRLLAHPAGLARAPHPGGGARRGGAWPWCGANSPIRSARG